MTGTITAAQEAARAIDLAGTGYDQGQRWSFLSSKVNPRLVDLVQDGEGDCSSVCGAIAAIAGYPVDLEGTFYTGNFKERLQAAGFTAILFVSLAQVRAGDFLLRPGKHVEFAYTADVFFSARIDENGRGQGGRAGDQTGREVRFSPAYRYGLGWTWILRPPDSGSGQDAPTPTIPTDAPVRRNPFGRPLLSEDGDMGGYTISEAQYQMGTPVDGVISRGYSEMTAAIQKMLNRLRHRDWNGRSLVVDGDGIRSNSAFRAPLVGRYRTLWALQSYLKVFKDGFLSRRESSTVKAMQRALNAGTFNRK